MSYVLSGSTRRVARWVRSRSIRREDYYADLELDAKVELIRSLVPLGLMHVGEVLDEEVTALAGERYARKDASPRRRPQRRHVVRRIPEQLQPGRGVSRADRLRGGAGPPVLRLAVQGDLPATSRRAADDPREADHRRRLTLR